MYHATRIDPNYIFPPFLHKIIMLAKYHYASRQEVSDRHLLTDLRPWNTFHSMQTPPYFAAGRVNDPHDERSFGLII